MGSSFEVSCRETSDELRLDKAEVSCTSGFLRGFFHLRAELRLEMGLDNSDGGADAERLERLWGLDG